VAKIKKIVIVGGGTSGWLSAAYMATKLGGNKNDGVEITLIESSDIETVGVGEATVPFIRNIVASLGIDEATFMKETSATFKMSIKFVDWLNNPDPSKPSHAYHHTFGGFGLLGQDLMAPYWVMDRENTDLSFVDYTMMEGRLCDVGCGPKRLTDKQFEAPVNYAYHFDAGLLAKLLKKLGSERGVKHLVGTVQKTHLDETGSIEYLETSEHGNLKADLYVDCTGFAAHIIGKAMGTEFHGLNDTLFCDKAIATQVNYDDPDERINPYTTATAQENGWTWDIPLHNRRGVGYVYSSKYTDDDRAEEVIRNYIGDVKHDYSLNKLNMRIGYRHTQWHKNCVAIGLAGGFIEPLESTGIYLADLGLRTLVDYLPTVEKMELGAKQYNAVMTDTYEDIVDFVKMHYCLTKRTDTDFWKDNKREDTIPDSLKEKLEAWKYRVPGTYEFQSIPKVFGLSNYLQVLYGMEHLPDLSTDSARYARLVEARVQSSRYLAASKGGQEILPIQRDLINDIYSKGFQKPK